MYQELIIPTEVSIKVKKTIVKGTVIRAAMFSRTIVMDVITEDTTNYFLIYYKNALIYGEQLDKVEEGSFIKKAFQEGIVIESPHPLLKSLVPNPFITISNKNKLFSQLQIQYSLQELAYIATTLDSFFNKDELIKIIDKVYYHYRRSGSFIKAFQIIRILRDFAPTLTSAKERLNSQEFHSYHDLYSSPSLPSILKKDPLFVELYCFQNRSNPDAHIFLEDLLLKQKGYNQLLLLWLENIDKFPKEDSIKKYTILALNVLTMKEWLLILSKMKINPYRELPEAKFIIETMVQEGHYETATLYLLTFIHDLPTSFNEITSILWSNLSAEFVVEHLDDFFFMFQQLVNNNNTDQYEQKIHQLSLILFEEHSLKTVHKKLLPIQKLFPHSAIILKLEKMVDLLENPDGMMELGEYYAEFKQFDKAIDCFLWEMELQPQDPSPVQKISKMYQQKGMMKEAVTFQKIHAQLISNQGIG
jgi:hypothetical protein